MLVKAAPGLNVPREDKPRDYITDAKAVEVAPTVYYLRALAWGDLLPAQAEAAPAAPKNSKKE